MNKFKCFKYYLTNIFFVSSFICFCRFIHPAVQKIITQNQVIHHLNQQPYIQMNILWVRLIFCIFTGSKHVLHYEFGVKAKSMPFNKKCVLELNIKSWKWFRCFPHLLNQGSDADRLQRFIMTKAMKRT